MGELSLDRYFPVIAVAVGRLDHQIVTGRRRRRIRNQGCVVAAHVAGEEEALGPVALVHLDLHRSGADDVSRAVEAETHSGSDLRPLPEVHHFDHPHRPLGILAGVERQRRFVLRVALLVGVLRVLFLDVGGVAQEQIRQVRRRRCGEDRSLVAQLDEPGQVPRVIDMGVGEDHRIYTLRIEARVLPVAFAELLRALEQPAIDQKLLAQSPKQMARARDGPGAAVEGEASHGDRITAIRASDRAVRRSPPDTRRPLRR